MTEDGKDGVEEDPTSEVNVSVENGGDEGDRNEYFKDQILEGKRKRFTPVAELTLNNWSAFLFQLLLVPPT